MARSRKRPPSPSPGPSKRTKADVIKPFALSYLEEVLNKAGLTLETPADDNSPSFTLKCKPIHFRSTLKNVLETNVDYPRNVQELLKGCELYMEDESKLRLLLKQEAIQGENNEETSVKLSAAQLLLSIPEFDCLLLKKAIEYSIMDKLDMITLLLQPLHLADTPSTSDTFSDKLIELLESSERPARLETISCLSNIVPARDQSRLADKLCSLMTQDYELTPAVLYCFSCFWLPSDLKADTRDRMLTMIKTSAPLKFFPNIVNFLFSDCSNERYTEIIDGLREGLDWTLITDEPESEISTSQILTMNGLKTALSSSKYLTNDWLKVINRIGTTADHKTLDLAVLIMIYSLKNGREKNIESIFKRRIELNIFTPTFLKNMIVGFKPMISEYVIHVLQLCRSLIESKTSRQIKEFAVFWYKTLYEEIEDCRRKIIDELIHREDVKEENVLSDSIMVLSEIAELNIELLKPFSNQILTLINHLGDLNTSDVSRVMNLLCGLAFRIDNTALEDDIHMIIRKQLGSSNFNIKCRGIAGAVMAIKHMIHTDPSEQSSETCSEISTLPYGKIKDAAQIAELVMNRIMKFPDLFIYFYDELADMLANCESPDSQFMSWLMTTLTSKFQNTYIVDEDDELASSDSTVKLSRQYKLDKVGENIALNIGGIVFGSNSDSVMLRTLPANFRLLQIVHKKANGGNLNEIDALLGCSVVMPDVCDDTLDGFEPTSSEKILSCNVHCINWFRELINAFSLQSDKAMIDKVYVRLNELLILEKNLAIKINKYRGLDYKIHCSTFGASLKNTQTVVVEKRKDPKKPRKTKKNLDTSGESTLNASAQTQATSPETQPSTSGDKCKMNSAVFRSLSIDSVKLFARELTVDNLNDDSTDSKMYLDSLLFLIVEFSPKIDSTFPTAAKTNRFKPVSMVANTRKNLDACIETLPRLLHFAEDIGKHLQAYLDDNDGIRDGAGIFSDQNVKCQMCLGQIFDILNSVFSWNGFQSPENKPKLSGYLKMIVNDEKPMPFKETVYQACKNLSQYKDYCFLLSTASSLIKLMFGIANTNKDANSLQTVVDVSLEMLQMIWRDVTGNTDKGLLYNQHVDTILSIYFSQLDIVAIKEHAYELYDQIAELSSRNFVHKPLQCINKANYPLLFRALCKSIYERTKNNLNNGMTDQQHLELWKDIVLTMKALVDLLKNVENRSNLAVFLKKSVPLLKLFITEGIPMMEIKLKTDPNNVLEILRMMQYSTRFLHTLYCHSRLKKDNAFIAYLPQMKLVLETLLFKVKGALIANNCSTAFWMGNLKSKNLQGDIILSQQSSNNESDDENQLPVDDSSDDECDMKSVSNIC